MWSGFWALVLMLKQPGIALHVTTCTEMTFLLRCSESLLSVVGIVGYFESFSKLAVVGEVSHWRGGEGALSPAPHPEAIFPPSANTLRPPPIFIVTFQGHRRPAARSVPFNTPTHTALPPSVPPARTSDGTSPCPLPAPALTSLPTAPSRGFPLARWRCAP
jgi:hypothetical protein